MLRNAPVLAVLFSLQACAGALPLSPEAKMSEYFPLATGLLWTYDVEETVSSESLDSHLRGSEYTDNMTVKNRVTSVENNGGIVTATLRTERGSAAPVHILERTPEGDIYSLITADPNTQIPQDWWTVSPARIIQQKAVVRPAVSGKSLRLFEGKVPVIGVSWDFQDKASSIQYTASSRQESVTTPAGTWNNALKVTQSAATKESADESISYYVSGVGLVRRSISYTNRLFPGVSISGRVEVVLTQFTKQ